MNQNNNQPTIGNNTIPTTGMGAAPQPTPQPMPVPQPIPQPMPASQPAPGNAQPMTQNVQPVRPIIRQTQNPVTQSMHEQVYTKPIAVPRPDQEVGANQQVSNPPMQPTMMQPQSVYAQAPMPIQSPVMPTPQPMPAPQPIPQAMPTMEVPTYTQPSMPQMAQPTVQTLSLIHI